MITKFRARPIRSSGRPRPPARRARTRRTVTRWSGLGNAGCTFRHQSRGGRRRLDSTFFGRPRRRPIGSLPSARRAARGRGVFPRSSLIRSDGPTAGRATAAPTLAGKFFLTLLSAGRTGYSSGCGRRSSSQRRSRRRSTRSDCTSTWSRRAQRNPHSGRRNSRACSPHNCSLG